MEKLDNIFYCGGDGYYFSFRIIKFPENHEKYNKQKPYYVEINCDMDNYIDIKYFSCLNNAYCYTFDKIDKCINKYIDKLESLYENNNLKVSSGILKINDYLYNDFILYGDKKYLNDDVFKCANDYNIKICSYNEDTNIFFVNDDIINIIYNVSKTKLSILN